MVAGVAPDLATNESVSPQRLGCGDLIGSPLGPRRCRADRQFGVRAGAEVTTRVASRAYRGHAPNRARDGEWDVANEG
jgi:hypothetical protein